MLRFLKKRKGDVRTKLAQLRPGPAPDWLASLLKSATKWDEGSGRYSWPEFELTLDVDRSVKKCAFGSRFPSDIEIERIHIEMPMKTASKVHKSLRKLDLHGFGTTYDLVREDKPWDILIDEVSDKIARIKIVPKGDADRRLAEATANIHGRQASWDRFIASDRWEMENDPDILLNAWLESKDAAAPWNNYPPTISQAYANWLRRAAPDELHQAVIGHNWSYSPAPLFYISRRRDCDLATALYIFYAADPRGMVKTDFDPAWNTRHIDFSLTLGIRDRILSNFYKRAEIAFDPSTIIGQNRQPYNLGPHFPIKLEGRVPAPLPMEDGYPLEVWKALSMWSDESGKN